MYCKNCGKELSDQADFCTGCGVKLTPQPAGSQSGELAPVLSIGQYIGMFILSAIPLVGIILQLVWAFGSGTNPNKQNYARATLIMAIVGAVLSTVLAIAAGGILAGIISQLGEYPYPY